jgi:hypothetical protein
MNLVSMTIPDNPAELPTWLETQLVGLDLAALVAELAAVHGRATAPPLKDVLGNQQADVLAGGLAALPRAALEEFLRHPLLLLELQELVLCEGGPYWQEIATGNAALGSMVLRGEQRLLSRIPAPSPPHAQPFHTVRPRLHTAWYRHPAVVSLATAAALLVILYLIRDPLARQFVGPAVQQESPPWGWSKLGAAAPGISPADYLNHLAESAAEWSQERPEDPIALARRIGQMRMGCSSLILAEHTPLSEEDRTWLRDRCRAWAEMFDKALADLERGHEVPEVRSEMDSTVNNAVEALQERARQRRA